MIGNAEGAAADIAKGAASDQTSSSMISDIEEIIELYRQRRHDLGIFMEGVVKYIGDHPDLLVDKRQIVHSYKYRLKDNDHLREKIIRKRTEGRHIDASNFFSQITDLAGVRILHLFQDDFLYIDEIIRRKVTQEGDWIFDERPKAYTWDPEAVEFFSKFDLNVSEKPTSYTSVHYVVRPRSGSDISCEIQVRTLFEEIWGEVDHQINYPVATDSIPLKEQIKVLSKIVGAGSRLLDSLNRVRGTASSVDPT